MTPSKTPTARRIAQDARRSRHAFCPRPEALEGRALLTTTTALDPTFGADGRLFNPFSTSGGSTIGGSTLGVQSDGKIIVAGGTRDAATGLSYLAVGRLNADGTVDTSFGTDGKVTIPDPPQGTGPFGNPDSYLPHDVAIQPDGSIDLAFSVSVPSTRSIYTVNEGEVVQLTPGGQLDMGFADHGQLFLPPSPTAGYGLEFSDVAAQADNKVVLLGADPDNRQLILARYNTNGTLDATFNGSGVLTITTPGGTADAYAQAAVVVAPGGQIYVAANATTSSSQPGSPPSANMVRVNSVGTLDTTFGTGGTLVVSQGGPTTPAPLLTDMALQSDGSVILVGHNTNSISGGSSGFIARVQPSGTVDTKFAGGTTNPALLTNIAAEAVVVGHDGTITVGGSDYNTQSYSIGIARFHADGSPDAGFGFGGHYTVPVQPATLPGEGVTSISGNGDPDILRGSLGLTASGAVIGMGITYTSIPPGTEQPLLYQIRPLATSVPGGDYDGDGKDDIAAILSGAGVYAYRPSTGGSDLLISFGAAGAGKSLPAPGDYDGNGFANLAVYIPSQGKLFYQSGATGRDVAISIGGPGDIPAPGDYDGDGITDAAVYDPSTGSFIIRDSSSGATQTLQFGAVGVDASVPAPGDYDGDGKTDLAVYIPRYGILAYRPSSAGNTTSDVLASFGMVGDRMSIPAPGDYDGDGKTDLAVYMPSIGVYAYRPSSAGGTSSDVLQSFGVVGDGATIPAPGDYDGDGKTDLAVYIPRDALFGYRPSSAVASGGDVLTSFGSVGDGATIPAASIPYAQPGSVTSMSLAKTPGDAGVPIALTDEVLAELAGPSAKKKHA